MAELIDVACDVCGQKYRLDKERVGYSTSCRECGTKFKVVEYTPPPDEEATGDSALPWIKGACVSALIVASLTGLGILPFYQPDPASRLVAANDPAPSRFSQPASPTFQPTQPQSPRQKDVDAKVQALREKLSRSGIGNPQAGTPGMPQGMPKGIPGMPGSGKPGLGTPGPGIGGPRGGNPIDLQKMIPDLNRPSGMPGPRFGRRGRAPGGPPGGPAGGPPAVPASPPVAGPVDGRVTGPETVPASGAPANAVPAGKSTGVAPVVTGWKISGGFGAQSMRLTGRGLQNVTKVQRLQGAALFDVQFAVAGDDELEAKQVVFGGAIPPLITVSSADGMAVVFSDDIQTVDSGASFESKPGGISVCRVRRGGSLESDKLVVLLVESGGRAKISTFTPLCFLEQGAELETISAHKFFAQEGAKITQRTTFPGAEVRAAALTFCPLASPASGK